jgi:pimeloyl-ACP methyl ester carboxylesterase
MTPDSLGPRPLTLDIDGITHYAEWRGAPDRAPVFVLLHDGLGCIANWRGFPDALARATGRAVFAYDRWGYGRSAPREAFPDDLMEDEAARLGRVLDAAGIAGCVLVGHSDGGTIALVHAADAPARIRAVVTMAAHVSVDPYAAVFLDELEADIAAGTPPVWLERFHGERGTHLLETWVRAWRQLFADGWDITARIGTIAAPLLSLQGGSDPHKVPDQLRWITAAVPGAETRSLDGLGHFPHLEQPDTVIDAIARFTGAEPGMTERNAK